MANYRTIQTRMWREDDWFQDLSVSARLLWLYLITNPSANAAGIYRLPLRTMAFESGIPLEEIKNLLSDFASAKKAYYQQGIVWVVKMRHYQFPNPNAKILKRIELDLKEIPEIPLKTHYIAYYNSSATPDAPSIPTPSPIDTLSIPHPYHMDTLPDGYPYPTDEQNQYQPNQYQPEPEPNQHQPDVDHQDDATEAQSEEQTAAAGAGGGDSDSQPQKPEKISITIPDDIPLPSSRPAPDPNLKLVTSLYEELFGQTLAPAIVTSIKSALQRDGPQRVTAALHETASRRNRGQQITAPWSYTKRILDRWHIDGPPQDLNNHGHQPANTHPQPPDSSIGQRLYTDASGRVRVLPAT